MDPNTFPTKGNLIAAKNSLNLANMGYGLMDKKRNILIRELMGMIDEAKGIQSEIGQPMPRFRRPTLNWALTMSRKSEPPCQWMTG